MLELLTAILAFAAMMILLSTLVTVMVETVQKFLALRQAGLQRMLEGLYESVLCDVLKRDLAQAPSSKKVAGAKFAEEIMRNPNSNRVANRSWFGRVRLWLRRRIVTTDFESLDTREFIEQLANTEAGDKLAKLTKPKSERALRIIAYQFERYGEAASDYFARRAGVLSVFIALALALIVNIDAVRTFRTLVLKPVVAQKLVEAMNVLEKAKPQQPQAKNGPTPTPGPDADAKASETNKTADQDAASAIDRVNQELAKLSAQGLPIGRAYFPFCYTYIDAEKAGATKADSSSKAEATPGVDMEACKDVPKREQYAGVWKDKWLLRHFESRTTDWLVYESSWFFWIIWHAKGLGWFLSTLLAGFLIGLGAPFWYDIYRKAALVLPVAQVASQFVSSGRKTVVAARPEDEAAEKKPGGESQSELPRSIRRSDKATIAPADLYDAFLRARSESPSPPKPKRKAAPKRKTTPTKKQKRTAVARRRR